MEIIKYPQRQDWENLTKRALADEAEEVSRTVSDIISRVRAEGDKALLDYERRFTGATLSDLKVTDREMADAETLVTENLQPRI